MFSNNFNIFTDISEVGLTYVLKVMDGKLSNSFRVKIKKK